MKYKKGNVCWYTSQYLSVKIHRQAEALSGGHLCNVHGGLCDPAELDAKSWHLKMTKTKPGVFLQI